MALIGDVAVSDPRAVEEFALRWGTAWNDHDGDAVTAMCAEDLVYDEPALGDTVYGRDAICNFMVATGAAFPDHQFTLEGLYADAPSSPPVWWSRYRRRWPCPASGPTQPGALGCSK
jgi:hypothetical protein